MLGIVITGHGGFASGLIQAIEQIVGKQSQCTAVDFPEGMSIEALHQILNQASKTCDIGDGLVFLTDLLGGTPFNQAAQLTLTHPHWQVLTGTNMQMAVEMMLERPTVDTEKFRDMALYFGHQGLTSLWHQQQQNKEFHSNNGI
ncbi:MAG TPA: PTS galactosamine/N-acetylgalactosamine transporter subunit IIA [Arsenophonus sp.]